MLRITKTLSTRLLFSPSTAMRLPLDPFVDSTCIKARQKTDRKAAEVSKETLHSSQQSYTEEGHDYDDIRPYTPKPGSVEEEPWVSSVLATLREMVRDAKK